jgi:hypothetical protein
VMSGVNARGDARGEIGRDRYDVLSGESIVSEEDCLRM